MWSGGNSVPLSLVIDRDFALQRMSQIAGGHVVVCDLPAGHKRLDGAPRTDLYVSVPLLQVFRGDEPIPLTEHQLEIMCALATAPRPLHRDVLMARVWPDSPDAAAHQALRTAITRLRHRLGDHEAVIFKDLGYSLGPRVQTDYWEIESLARDDQLTTEIAEAKLPRFRDVFELLARRAPVGSRWEWFVEMEAFLEATFRRIGCALGRRALADGRTCEAIGIARRVLQRDACDDGARAIVVRAMMSIGDRVGALREIHEHELALTRELGVTEVSPLRALLP